MQFRVSLQPPQMYLGCKKKELVTRTVYCNKLTHLHNPSLGKKDIVCFDIESGCVSMGVCVGFV